MRLNDNKIIQPQINLYDRVDMYYSGSVFTLGEFNNTVLTIIGYMTGIRKVIGFLFSLELMPVFDNRSNVILITNIGCYCLWHYHWHY